MTKKYGELVAVDRLNLSVKTGEILGLLGPNGAGKTTIISMLSTMLTPTQGTAKVNGFDIISQPDAVRSSIGIVFQEPSVDDELTGLENLRLHAMWYGVPRNVRSTRTAEILKLTGLEDRKNDLVKKYSGGMRRRLELGRGLLHHPKVLFLDEPTLGLDPQTRSQIWNYIADLAKREGITIVLTTHYMEEAEELCDRIAIIDKGRIVVLDTVEALERSIGGDFVCIRTREPKAEVFKNLDYVKKVEVDGDLLVLTVENASEHVQDILDRAGKVERIEVRPATLNDVFLHFTGREIREEAGEGGVFQRIMRVETKR
ncbi:MAG: ATP-binding cassette domain-containing protein [archaeon]